MPAPAISCIFDFFGDVFVLKGPGSRSLHTLLRKWCLTLQVPMTPAQIPCEWTERWRTP